MIVFVLIAAVVLLLPVLRLCFYLRVLGSERVSELPDVDAERYLPMLRLLPNGHPSAPRRALFRQYLRELTIDYGKLLAGIRLIAVNSDVERPDLARILVVKRLSFSVAACRLEAYLLLHSLRLIDSRMLELEIFGLVDSALLLRRLFPVESAVWGA